jgi:hypothetical protein
VREPLDDQAVAETAVADREGLAAQLREDAAHDAGAREDDGGAVRLQPDDLPSLLGITGAVELDLTVG